MLYSSGYVLIAFLQGGLVQDLGWLSEHILLDAVAVRQFTLGRLFSTATFIGYLLRGVPGAVVAAMVAFLPPFVFVAAFHSLVARLRGSPWWAAFLVAVNVASLGLMAAVTVKLATATLVDWRCLLIAAVAALCAFRWKATSALLVIGGSLAGC